MAIAVNAALIYVVNNLLEWDLLPFLTRDFERLLPIVRVSLVASIVVNAVYLGYDARWFKSLGEIVVNSIGLAVAVRTLQVFPFDFSAYEFDWEAFSRVVLILAVVAIVVSILVEAAKLLKGALDGQT